MGDYCSWLKQHQQRFLTMTLDLASAFSVQIHLFSESHSTDSVHSSVRTLGKLGLPVGAGKVTWQLQ